MPTETRARPLAPELTLPPPFTLVRLRELGDAFAHAKSIAAEQGAGTLVYVGRFDLAEFAVVLEPDEPLAQARGAFYAGMAALADALAAHAQPETAITIDWPDSIAVNHRGGGSLPPAFSWSPWRPGGSAASARWCAAIWSGCRPSRACAATSTRTAICCCAAWARSRSSAKRCWRGWPSKPGSIR